MKAYILKLKNSNKYFRDIDFGFEIMTFKKENAKVFYSKEDAEIFNNDYMNKRYDIIEIGE